MKPSKPSTPAFRTDEYTKTLVETLRKELIERTEFNRVWIDAKENHLLVFALINTIRYLKSEGPLPCNTYSPETSNGSKSSDIPGQLTLPLAEPPATLPEKTSLRDRVQAAARETPSEKNSPAPKRRNSATPTGKKKGRKSSKR